MTRKKILQYPTTPNIEEYKKQRSEARRIIKKETTVSILQEKLRKTDQTTE